MRLSHLVFGLLLNFGVRAFGAAPVVAPPADGKLSIRGRVGDALRPEAKPPCAGAEVFLFAAPPDAGPLVRCSPKDPQASVEQLWRFKHLCPEVVDQLFDLAARDSLSQKPLARTTADDAGRFEFAVAPGKYDLVALPRGGVYGVALDVSPGAEVEILADSAPRRTVARFHRSGGMEPGAGVKVLTGLMRPRFGIELLTTDAKGEAQAKALDRGWFVLARADGHLPFFRTCSGSCSISGLDLTQPLPVKGRVTEGGKPVAGARVTALDGLVRETVTDAQGRFSIETMPVGGGKLRAEHQGKIALFDFGTREGIELRLGRVSRLKFDLRDAKTGNPISNPKLAFRDSEVALSEENPLSPVVSASGWYEVPAGTYLVGISAHCYEMPVYSKVKAAADKEQVVTVALENQCSEAGE